LHAVEFAQMKPFGQGTPLFDTQLPAPSQAVPVSSAPLHMAPLPQGLSAAVSSQKPPALHLPSFPHGGLTGHWLAGAALPARMLAHVPVGMPVSATVQA
jgi:hypothetical protein